MNTADQITVTHISQDCKHHYVYSTYPCECQAYQHLTCKKCGKKGRLKLHGTGLCSVTSRCSRPGRVFYYDNYCGSNGCKGHPALATHLYRR